MQAWKKFKSETLDYHAASLVEWTALVFSESIMDKWELAFMQLLNNYEENVPQRCA